MPIIFKKERRRDAGSRASAFGKNKDAPAAQQAPPDAANPFDGGGGAAAADEPPMGVAPGTPTVDVISYEQLQARALAGSAPAPAPAAQPQQPAAQPQPPPPAVAAPAPAQPQAQQQQQQAPPPPANPCTIAGCDRARPPGAVLPVCTDHVFEFQQYLNASKAFADLRDTLFKEWSQGRIQPQEGSA